MKKSIVAGAAAVGLALGGAVVIGSTAVAETPSPSPSATATGSAAPDQGGRGGGQHTAVTGDEAQKVIDAVQAKNAGVTISTVQKDSDGSYDAIGTKSDGSKVSYDVSADLATITERTR